MRAPFVIIVSLLLSTTVLTPTVTYGDSPAISSITNRFRICRNTETAAITVRRRCRARRNEEVVDFTALQGSDGAQGPAGDDGQLRIYGDESGGARTVSSNTTLGNDSSDNNLQYTDFTINSGVTLTVPSGTVIRCTGTFTNNGTVTIETGSPGGTVRGVDSSTDAPAIVSAHPGISSRAAMNGEYGDNTATRSGGLGGAGLAQFTALQIRYPGVLGGGGGGASGAGAQDIGHSGGGSMVVLCQTAIVNNGTITADGDGGSFSGGGAGGIVILASQTAVTNSSTGSITAVGGDGEDGDSDESASGGGGGGIIHLLAPTITNNGTLSAAGGSPGVTGAAGSVGASLRSGGGGGGACGGNGGQGGGVNSNGDPLDGDAGTVGYTFTSEIDPTALF